MRMDKESHLGDTLIKHQPTRLSLSQEPVMTLLPRLL